MECIQKSSSDHLNVARLLNYKITQTIKRKETASYHKKKKKMV